MNILKPKNENKEKENLTQEINTSSQNQLDNKDILSLLEETNENNIETIIKNEEKNTEEIKALTKDDDKENILLKSIKEQKIEKQENVQIFKEKLSEDIKILDVSETEEVTTIESEEENILENTFYSLEDAKENKIIFSNKDENNIEQNSKEETEIIQGKEIEAISQNEIKPFSIEKTQKIIEEIESIDISKQIKTFESLQERKKKIDNELLHLNFKQEQLKESLEKSLKEIEKITGSKNVEEYALFILNTLKENEEKLNILLKDIKEKEELIENFNKELKEMENE